jgi:3-dehydroquinate dehydratase-2
MSPALKILVIHGPNLNMLGTREPGIYGAITLDEINAGLIQKGKALNMEVHTFQSNHEGGIVDKIQQAIDAFDGLIINPAAYTHTSIAIRDALLLLHIPVVEVHLSDIHQRESFRRNSMISDIVAKTIMGLGHKGYAEALQFLGDTLRTISEISLT